MDWHEVIDSVPVKRRKICWKALWMQDEEAAATGIDKAHH